jgi:hypothetical protein
LIDRGSVRWPSEPCQWCGCVGYHAEICEGFVINDPAYQPLEYPDLPDSWGNRSVEMVAFALRDTANPQDKGYRRGACAVMKLLVEQGWTPPPMGGKDAT